MGQCSEHDKLCYRTRGAARHVAKQLHRYHVNTYYCGITDSYHVGGLPSSVIHGKITRGEIYGESA